MNEHATFDGKNITPFDEAKIAVDDLFDEAEAWLDGNGISNEAEAKAVETLLDLARKAKTAADTARKKENEPFDTGKAEVQARYNPVLKRADIITETCKTVLQPWRDKIATEKAAAAETARIEAEEIRAKANEAMRASSGNITARADAEHLLSSAKIAEKDAAKAGKQATTGLGLRTSYRPVMTDGAKAAEHYWTARRADFQAFLQDFAAQDVRKGIHVIPGFDVVEEKTAV